MVRIFFGLVFIFAVIIASPCYPKEGDVDPVVNSIASGQINTGYRDSVVDIYAESESQGTQRYVGRGIIVHGAGYVIANYHCVLLTKGISIHLSDGKKYPGKIFYYNENYDICILRVNAPALPKIALADSDLVYIGQPMYALGTGDIAKANVCATTLSEIKYFNNFRWFTFFAPLSKESSGTPLVNAKGQIIGIITFVRDDSKCFALAVNQIKKYFSAPDSVPAKEPGIESLSRANLFFIEGYRDSLFGNHGDALRNYQKVLELNPKSALTYNNIGNTYDALGDHSQAISCYEKAIAIDPAIGEVYFNLGNTYVALGNKLQAITTYKKALQANGNLVEACFNLGNVFYESANLDQAIAYYENAVSIDPYFPEVYYNLGNAYYAQSRFAEAVSSYENATKINPNNANAYLNLGRSYYSLGLIKDAKDNFIRAKKIFNNQKDFKNLKIVDEYLKEIP